MAEQNTLKWIKFLVFFMGGLIIIGVIALVIGLVNQAGKLGDDAQKTEAQISPPFSQNKQAWQKNIALGDDDYIALINQSDARLTLLIENEDESKRIIVLDINSGAIIGEIDFISDSE